jgi:hypothetical protein
MTKPAHSDLRTLYVLVSKQLPVTIVTYIFLIVLLRVRRYEKSITCLLLGIEQNIVLTGYRKPYQGTKEFKKVFIFDF